MTLYPGNSKRGISILDEIFSEETDPHNKSCNCNECRIRKRQENYTRSNVRELGWELNGEEELELGKAFDKIKSLARKGYNMARPWIVTADIIRRLVSPPAEPVAVMKDVAAFIEQQKKRNTDDAIEQAALPRKNNFRQKPVPEMSILQEIFLENEHAELL